MAFSKRGLPIVAIVSRTPRSARRLGRLVGCNANGTSIDLVSTADLILLSVPDKALSECAVSLAGVRFSSPVVTVVHTSGVHPHLILKPAKKNPHTVIETASMHPIQSFAGHSRPDVDVVTGIHFGVDGDRPAVKRILRIIERIHAFHIRVPVDLRALYHSGAVIASNFLIALLAESSLLYRHLGLSERQSMKLLTPLVVRSLRNVQQIGAKAALTGPASRGDHDTLAKQRKALRIADMEFIAAYKCLTRLCERLAGSTKWGK